MFAKKINKNSGENEIIKMCIVCMVVRSKLKLSIRYVNLNKKNIAKCK